MIINRRVMRGRPLDDQCRDFGGIMREIDGKGDPRRYCTGYSVIDSGEIHKGCASCKAFYGNATPWKGERDGILPGQISMDEYMRGNENDNGMDERTG